MSLCLLLSGTGLDIKGTGDQNRARTAAVSLMKELD